MRARVKFAKYGAMKFIGHLELMRFMHGAVRRAGLPVKYDEGMHRRMVMSFAMPLGVGATSSAEYMDIEMEEPVPTETAMRLLGEQMCEGIDILDFREVDGSKKMKAMTIVAAAVYDVKFREGYEPEWDWREDLRTLLSLETIPWVKETKKGTRELDMRPLIYSVDFEGVKGSPDLTDGSLGFRACLCCSVGENLKPEQLIGELYRRRGQEMPAFALIVHRVDLLTRQDEKLISLGDLGNPIS